MLVFVHPHLVVEQYKFVFVLVFVLEFVHAFFCLQLSQTIQLHLAESNCATGSQRISMLTVNFLVQLSVGFKIN